MGLLDALFQGSPGSGGGLLDFLRNNALNQQMPGLAPQDTAQYGTPPAQMQPQMAYAPNQPPPQFAPVTPQQNAQPSPLDTAQYPFGPMGAPSQANAQMPPQQPPPVIQAQPMQPAQVQPPQDNSPGIMDRLSGLARPGSIMGAIMGTPNPANLTKQWLMQRGVDPVAASAAIANPAVLTSLIQQLKPQALINTGSGHLYDPNTKQDIKTYTPEDRVPIGFSIDDNGNMHFIKNGPADPAYLRLKAAQEADPNAVHVLGKGGELYKVDEKGNPTIVHKNDAGVDATLDDGTATMMAQQYLAGDKTVLQNVGRGAQGSANLMKIRTAIKDQADKQGLDGNAVAQRMIDYVGDTARERTAATQEGRMSPAGIEAHGAIQLGRAASAAVPRGQFVPLNQLQQAMQRSGSDPALRALDAANTTIINTYARAINPNGIGTVADKEHARQMLITADSGPTYNKVLDQLEKEIEMAHASPSQARAGFKQEREGRLNGQPPAQPPFSPNAAPAAPKALPLPQPGDMQGGYRFKGGNPADKANWEPAT